MPAGEVNGPASGPGVGAGVGSGDAEALAAADVLVSAVGRPLSLLGGVTSVGSVVLESSVSVLELVSVEVLLLLDEPLPESDRKSVV